jgi:cytochrome c-type biogenesis protein CcmH/NrfG
MLKIVPDKIEMLREILAQDPQNAFARYGLAMEYAQRDDVADAIAEFDALLAAHPEYVAEYHMAGQTLLRARQAARAAEYLRRGVEQARRAGNTHAESEISALLDEAELA